MRARTSATIQLRNSRLHHRVGGRLLRLYWRSALRVIRATHSDCRSVPVARKLNIVMRHRHSLCVCSRVCQPACATPPRTTCAHPARVHLDPIDGSQHARLFDRAAKNVKFYDGVGGETRRSASRWASISSTLDHCAWIPGHHRLRLAWYRPCMPSAILVLVTTKP